MPNFPLVSKRVISSLFIHMVHYEGVNIEKLMCNYDTNPNYIAKWCQTGCRFVQAITVNFHLSVKVVYILWNGFNEVDKLFFVFSARANSMITWTIIFRLSQIYRIIPFPFLSVYVILVYKCIQWNNVYFSISTNEGEIEMLVLFNGKGKCSSQICIYVTN